MGQLHLILFKRTIPVSLSGAENRINSGVLSSPPRLRLPYLHFPLDILYRKAGPKSSGFITLALALHSTQS